MPKALVSKFGNKIWRKKETNRRIRIRSGGKREGIQMVRIAINCRKFTGVNNSVNVKRKKCEEARKKRGKDDLLVSDGMCLPTAETAVANTRPKSAITVNVNGIPIKANSIQNARPLVVTGTILP